MLRRDGPVVFDKLAVREPYDDATRDRYARDKRYKDPVARQAHFGARQVCHQFVAYIPR